MELVLQGHVLEKKDALGIPIFLLFTFLPFFFLLLLLFYRLTLLTFDGFLQNSLFQLVFLIVEHHFGVVNKKGTVHQNETAIRAIVLAKSGFQLPEQGLRLFVQSFHFFIQ